MRVCVREKQGVCVRVCERERDLAEEAPVGHLHLRILAFVLHVEVPVNIPYFLVSVCDPLSFLSMQCVLFTVECVLFMVYLVCITHCLLLFIVYCGFGGGVYKCCFLALAWNAAVLTLLIHRFRVSSFGFRDPGFGGGVYRWCVLALAWRAAASRFSLAAQYFALYSWCVERV